MDIKEKNIEVEIKENRFESLEGIFDTLETGKYNSVYGYYSKSKEDSVEFKLEFNKEGSLRCTLERSGLETKNKKVFSWEVYSPTMLPLDFFIESKNSMDFIKNLTSIKNVSYPLDKDWVPEFFLEKGKLRKISLED